jgi:hypothetical protein
MFRVYQPREKQCFTFSDFVPAGALERHAGFLSLHAYFFKGEKNAAS